jgi:Ca-activated chloride channel family protein
VTPIDNRLSLAGFEFQHPSVLALLLVMLPLLWWLGRRGPLPSIAVPTLRGAAALGTVPRRHFGAARFLWLAIPLTLLVAALARPRLPKGDLPDPSKGIDIMLTLDYSRSMAETDFRLKGRRVMRKDALVAVTEEFIGGRPNDRIGIVCFARNPWLVSPLTLDHGWVRSALREAEMATGTGIGWAIQASVNFLKKASERSRVLILITDGDNSAGPRPLEIAPAAIAERVKVYTVLIGPEMVTPSAAANHELNRVARMTGGQFFQANDSRALEGIYRLIDQLEKKELVQKRFVTWQELFPWFAGAGLGCWLLGIVVSDLGRRRVG